MQILDIPVFKEVVHFLTKLPQRISRIAAGVFIIYAQQDFLHRNIIIHEPFEADKLARKKAEFILVFCRCQQKQDGVEIAFFRNDTISPQIRSQNISMNTEVFIFSRFGIDSRRRQQQLTGIDAILIGTIPFKGMPSGTGFKGEVIDIIGHSFRISLLPRPVMHYRCHKGTDIVTAAKNIFAGFYSHFYTVPPHLAPGVTGMDFGIDIESSKERIKRARRRLSHECVINSLVIHIARLVVNMTILFVNL